MLMSCGSLAISKKCQDPPPGTMFFVVHFITRDRHKMVSYIYIAS